MIKKTVIVCWFLIFLLSCSPSALSFKIQYERITGLKPEQKVVYESNPIGSITTIELSKEGHYVVTVVIEPEHVNKVTISSEFFIITDPQQPNQQAIEVVSVLSEDGEVAVLKDGAMVKGMEVTAQTDVFVKGLKQGLTEGLGGLKQQLELFTNQLEQLPESKEFKQFEKELKRFGEEMGKAGKQIQNQMDKEIIPGLQKELDKLQKQFRKSPPPVKQKTKPEAIDA